MGTTILSFSDRIVIETLRHESDLFDISLITWALVRLLSLMKFTG